jgi:hypothetical protein
MKLSAVFIALLFSTFCVLAQDSKNELKVKINHDFKIGSAGESGRKNTIQFNYDTKEVLQITNKPEDFEAGIFLKRGEVAQFKILMEKMLKFADAIYENKITGVKKKFEDKSLWTSLVRGAPQVNISETGDPTDKTDIEVMWPFIKSKNASIYFTQEWNYAELQELAKFFDKRQKEVFKKYDILKALND